MVLTFDTETTGKIDWQADFRAPHQPHICQLGAMFASPEGELKAHLSLLIQPNGWTIPAEATAIHGITTDQCMQYGVPIMTAMSALYNWARLSTWIVGHNVAFDIRMVECELARLNKPVLWEFKESHFCTMHNMTSVCKLPKPSGTKGYKFPKLAEAYKHAFGAEHDKQHDAFGDVQATAKLFFWMRAQGLVHPKLPKQ